jgi:hypothetical protein
LESERGKGLSQALLRRAVVVSKSPSFDADVSVLYANENLAAKLYTPLGWEPVAVTMLVAKANVDRLRELAKEAASRSPGVAVAAASSVGGDRLCKAFAGCSAALDGSLARLSERYWSRWVVPESEDPAKMRYSLAALVSEAAARGDDASGRREAVTCPGPAADDEQRQVRALLSVGKYPLDAEPFTVQVRDWCVSRDEADQSPERQAELCAALLVSPEGPIADLLVAAGGLLALPDLLPVTKGLVASGCITVLELRETYAYYMLLRDNVPGINSERHANFFVDRF